jgi:hypothetical protein
MTSRFKSLRRSSEQLRKPMLRKDKDRRKSSKPPRTSNFNSRPKDSKKKREWKKNLR